MRLIFLGGTGIRHSCEQDDNLALYSWTEHDGRSAGVQIIKDLDNNVLLKTELLKTPGGSEGGSWAVRISGEPIDAGKELVYQIDLSTELLINSSNVQNISDHLL